MCVCLCVFEFQKLFATHQKLGRDPMVGPNSQFANQYFRVILLKAKKTKNANIQMNLENWKGQQFYRQYLKEINHKTDKENTWKWFQNEPCKK